MDVSRGSGPCMANSAVDFNSRPVESIPEPLVDAQAGQDLNLDHGQCHAGTDDGDHDLVLPKSTRVREAPDGIHGHQNHRIKGDMCASDSTGRRITANGTCSMVTGSSRILQGDGRPV
jgi:hypothetical protein